jgi:hypothetical protein
MYWIIKISIYLGVIAFLVFIYVKYIENKAIYFPDKELEYTPKILNLNFENIYLKTQDRVEIHGWFIPSSKANYTLLFCHGNAGNIAHRLEKISIFHNLGLNIFIFDYRGYGESKGRPSEKGLYLDLNCVYDYLVNQRKIPSKKIILYGESLGSAVVIDLASYKKIGGIILEGSFSSGKDLAKEIYPFLPSFFFSDKFNSLSKINKIDAPKLFIHSKDDEIIPIKYAKKLFYHAKEPKYFVEIEGDHNGAFVISKDKYISAIDSFIEKLYKINN